MCVGLFLVGSFKITNLILLLVIGLLRFSISVIVIFFSLCLSGNLSISSKLSNLLAVIYTILKNNRLLQ